MKIAVINASSVKHVNSMLYEKTCAAAREHEVINFGCMECDIPRSYVDIAFEAALLLNSGAVDFVVTGCSSGQGMMLAMNSMPGVMCGCTPTPQDAFLFAKINNGNAVSLPLALGNGWCGELNIGYTLEALFSAGFGGGYPEGDEERKTRDALRLKSIKAASQRPFEEFISSLPEELKPDPLCREIISEYIKAHKA